MAGGQMPPDDLRAWMTEHEYSVRLLARALGVSATTVSTWRTGRHEIPSYLRLALERLAERPRPVLPHRPRITEAALDEAVRRMQEHGETLPGIAEDLGVSHSGLWRALRARRPDAMASYTR